MSTVGRAYAGSLIPEGRRKSDVEARVALLRVRAQADFDRRGWPSSKDEFWRGFSLDDVSSVAWERPAPGSSSAVEIPGWIRALGGRQVVVVDGRWAWEAGEEAGSEGVACESLAKVMGRSADPSLRAFGALSAGSSSVMTALNTARWEDGVWIRIPKHARVPLVVIAHVASSQAAPTVSHPRVLVTAAEGSRCVVAEIHLGPSPTPTFVNAVCEIDVDADAEVEHVRVLAPGDGGWHVGSTHVRQEDSSRYCSRVVSMGGHAVRDEVHVTQSGDGADTELDGLFLAFGERHLDHRTMVDHSGPRGRSRQLYKGIADGRGKGGFRGRVLVREGAPGTDALQVSRNLVLSRDALVDSAPELEINADDVRCKHGSTTGALDEDARFYLRCRGIGDREATELLTAAFAREIVARVGPPALQEALAGQVDREVRGSALGGRST